MAGPPPMDPAMMQQLQMALMDPNVQAMLQQIGIIIDPQRGPVDTQTGQVIPPEEMLMILQELMAQIPPPGAAPGAPPAGGAPMPPPEGAMPPKVAEEDYLLDDQMEKEAQPMPMAPAGPPAGAPIAPAGPADTMPPEAPPAPAPAVPIEEPEVPGGDIEQRLSQLEDLVGEIAAKLEMNPETKESVIDEGFTDEAKAATNPEEEMEAEKVAAECACSDECTCDGDCKCADKCVCGETVEEAEKQEENQEETIPEELLSGDSEEKKAEEKPIEKKASSSREPTAAQKLTKLIGKLRSAYNN
jgi:hypothetical protein